MEHPRPVASRQPSRVAQGRHSHRRKILHSLARVFGSLRHWSKLSRQADAESETSQNSTLGRSDGPRRLEGETRSSRRYPRLRGVPLYVRASDFPLHEEDEAFAVTERRCETTAIPK